MIFFPFAAPSANSQPILSQYDMTMVLLSYVVAAVASILAMTLADSANQFASKRDQKMALLGGAMALGAAVWSMHFIGMLAFELCVTVKYAHWPTLLSILPAFVAAWVAMHWLSQKHQGGFHLFFGGLTMGAGIGVMHYSGMLAMQTPATMGFDVSGVIISVLDAVALATLALWFRHVGEQMHRLYAWRHVISGLAMGAAITIMHYVGMSSARFVGAPEFSNPVATVDRWYLSLLIALGAFALVGVMTAQNMLARQRQLSRELQFKEHQMRVIFQNAIDAIVITNRSGIIQTVNRSFEGLFGYQAQFALGKHVSMLIPNWASLPVPSKLKRQTDVSDQWVTETKGRHAQGQEIPLRIAMVYVQEHEQELYVGFLMDMTMFHTQQRILEKQLTEDPLTGLTNRRGLHQVLSCLHQEAQDFPMGIILLFIDLDGFKAVNDRYGHAAGDEVLVAIAQRLQRAVRQEDMVCRFGGDEFVIMLRYVAEPKMLAERIIKKITQAIHTPITLTKDVTVEVGCSMGVAYERANNLHAAERLLQRADGAMYQAKKAGGNHVIYEHEAELA